MKGFDDFHDDTSRFRHGLPATVYLDPDFHELENRTVFSRRWVFCGFVHELEKPGDVCPVTVGGQPLLLVRNGSGKLRAFNNVCSHRCLKLVDQPRNCGKLIRCPYHAWAYDLDGQLRATPYFGGYEQKTPQDFDVEQHGLVEVRCETWHDWIFVNLDGSAPPLSRYVDPLKEEISDLDLSNLKPVATLDLGIVKTNWKTLMENFIEPYHVQFVHNSTTEQPLVDHHTVINEHCLGSACDIEQPPGEQEANVLAVTSQFLTLFPNFVMGTYAPDQVGVHLNVPVDHQQTHQRRVIYVHEDNPISDQQIADLESLWTAVHREDHEICERLQEGRKSRIAADGGYLSPVWEDSVRRFQNLLVEAIDEAV